MGNDMIFIGGSASLTAILNKLISRLSVNSDIMFHPLVLLHISLSNVHFALTNPTDVFPLALQNKEELQYIISFF